MIVLVTGSDGFLGRHLCRELVRRGHSVTGFDFTAGQDILKLEQLRAVVRRVRPDAVLHLAAVADLNFFRDDAVGCEKINVEGTRNVLRVCQEAGARMLFASTCCCYGNNGCHPSHEASPLAPAEPYALSKMESEADVQAAGAPHTILRLATMYGPGMRAALAPATFLDRAHRGLPLLIHGTGKQNRTFTYITDVVLGVVAVLEHEPVHRVVNVSTDVAVSVLDIARMALHITGSSSQLENVTDRDGQVFREEINSDRLRSLGWAPLVDLETGMRASYADYLRCGARWTQHAGVTGLAAAPAAEAQGSSDGPGAACAATGPDCGAGLCGSQSRAPCRVAAESVVPCVCDR